MNFREILTCVVVAFALEFWAELADAPELLAVADILTPEKNLVRWRIYNEIVSIAVVSAGGRKFI